jgi:chromate reductase
MMGDKQTVLVICGSLRRGSYNALIARNLPALAPPEMTIVPAPSIGTLPLYNFDVQSERGFPAEVTELADAIRAASGVLFVTPEYNYSVPGVLKNAIDWVSRLQNQPLAGKPVAIQSSSPSVLGGARAQYHLRQTMVFLDALVFNRPEIMVTFVNTKVDEAQGVLTDEPTRKLIAQQLAAFSKFIARMSVPA